MAGAYVFGGVAAGGTHTCGVTVASGGDSSGTGDGVTGPDPSLTPVAVAGGHLFDAVAAGGYHTCGATAAGETACWGSNDAGQVG